jgi:hypothetical protein
LADEEKLFEKIIPKEKILEEEKLLKEKDVSKVVEKREEAPDAEVSPAEKKDLSHIDKKPDESKKKTDTMSHVDKELGEFKEKVYKFENLLKGFEDIDVLQEKMGKLEKIKDFSGLLAKFDEKLKQIEESKEQVIFLRNNVKKMYKEIDDKLYDLQTVLKKTHNLDSLYTRMENFEFYIKNKIKDSSATWEFSREAVEQMKLSILEQKFLALLLAFSSVKERNLKTNILEKLNKIVDDMKSKNLWDLDKKLLLEEILKTQGEDVTSYYSPLE